MSGAPVPGVVNVHQGISPGGSLQVLSVKVLRNTEKKEKKLNAVHGYFQLGLDKVSSQLTTFLLPQGKYRYLRAPMGLNASSDKWCCQSDVLIREIPWARKIVDDTLIWAKKRTWKN